MERRALIIGIDSYNQLQGLSGCVADASIIFDLLRQNDDGSSNYQCRLLTSSDSEPITRASFRREWQRLFQDFTGEVLFYFAGHGAPNEIGGYLCMQDATRDEPGIGMHDLVRSANHSEAREVCIIIDTCYGFYPGRSARLNEAIIESPIQLREGVTLLGAASPKSMAKEIDGRGVFTTHLAKALSGAAADVRGYVTAASVYAYIEQLLGAWDQRPLFQANVNRFSSLRRCKSIVSDDLLRELTRLFPEPSKQYQLNPSYEFTHESAVAEHVEILNEFKCYRDANLLRTVEGDDLFFAALNSNSVELTFLGQFYWQLAKDYRI